MKKPVNNPFDQMVGDKPVAKLSWYQRLKLRKHDRKTRAVTTFAHRHRNLLVIVMDPSDDTVFASYKDRQVYNKLKTADGENHRIIKSVLKMSSFRSRIDYFLTSFVDIMQTPIKHPDVNQLMAWIDGAVYNIAKSLNIRK